MSPTVTIQRSRAAEARAATEILACAFADDPVALWAWPDVALLPQLSRAFFTVFVNFVQATGEAVVDESGRGAALWLQVDPLAPAKDDSALGEALAAACGPFADRLAVLDELMSARHPMHTAHAYLPFIGVTPEGQGKGIGSSLLRAKLEALDRAGRPAYLEATRPENIRLYERHGFVRAGTGIDLPDGPSLQPMWREPRRS